MTDLRSKSRLWLGDLGYLVETVERWNSFTRRKADLWGFADLLAIRRGEVLAVQVTSKHNRASHVSKIANSVKVERVREADILIHLHLWEKVGNRWILTVEDLS